MSLEDKPKFDSIVEALGFHNAHTPTKLAYRYLTDGETEGPTLTYAEVYAQSQKIAQYLLTVAQPGDRALLLYPQGLEFVTALFGCFMAGIIAVPIYPPTGKRRTDRLENVARDCGPSLALTLEGIGKQVQLWFQDNVAHTTFKWVYSDNLPEAKAGDLPQIKSDQVALLQYTSGSTGDPKGVEVTHSNLVHNNHELLRAVDNCTEVVCWLPIYHDMGLIGNIIFVVYCGGTLSLMSPVDFVRKPIRWLKALSNYKATGTGAPNFAYDLCTRNISDEDLVGVDLSHWHATCNGAEPIRPKTLRKFTKRFEKVGFREEVFVPCYGLAEATALVAGGRAAVHYLKLNADALFQGSVEPAAPGLPSQACKELASSGPPAHGMQVEIVNPHTLQHCAPNEIGEVWVQGQSVAKGYWQKPELNKEVFEAQMLGASGSHLADKGKWLRTGDMGFLYKGMLYISGRLKEMLVINGANVFPQDIERTIQDVSPAFTENSGAVFGVEAEDGSERIIAFQEVSRTSVNDLKPNQLFSQVSDRVLASNEIALSGVYLISPGRLPKTTSGKIKRLECAKAYQNKQIPGLLHHWDIMDMTNKTNDPSVDNASANTPPKEVTRFSTLVEAIAYHNKHIPDEVAYRFLIDGEVEGDVLTRKQVYDRSRAIAAELRKHAKPGDRVILLYPSGLEFITAFFGCLMAGLIAVPMYPPSGRRRLDRLESVAKDCTPVLAVSITAVTEQAQTWFAERDVLKDIKWLNSDLITAIDEVKLPELDPQDIAFLQYTSGSTGDPKGVEVTHANIVHNNHMTTFAMTPLTSMVSWLPIYHDMGLIGNILLSTYVGVPLTLMSPVDFIRKPIRWLRAISKYRPQVSGAPNFAFDLCTQQVTDEELEGLDLSSYTSACNGAEPVKPSTLKKFRDRFGPVGFGEKAFLPCYGMAEATLMVTGKHGCNTPIEVDSNALLEGNVKLTKDHPETKKKREVVSSGPFLPEMRAVIVDPETKKKAVPHTIGEIWIQGDSVAKGYWKRPELTKEVFHAKILDDNNQPIEAEGMFLRSGDMGFIHDDLLYITGRLKEMLIIGGANIFPQDIERTVQGAHEHLQENAGAVFSVEEEGSTEKVVIFQEISRANFRDFNADEIYNAVSKDVMFHHELAVGGIYLISPGGIPKTTSGKIQRTKCRQAYLDGDIPSVLAHWDIQDIKMEAAAEALKPTTSAAPSPAANAFSRKQIESFLFAEIAKLTGIAESKLDGDTSFANLGMSSIQGIQLAEKLSKMLGQEVPATDLYNYSSVSQMAGHLVKGQVHVDSLSPESQTSQSAEAPAGAFKNEPIAIIGMSCQFPGAESVDAYWDLLSKGRDAVEEVPASRWNSADFFAEKQAPGKMVTKWGGFVDGVDLFDAAFFEISPREAALMDPQQRLLLQETYRLLEASGYPSQQLRGSNVGVYVGIAGSDYAGMLLRDVDDRNIYVATGGSYSIASNRLSYYFDFAGPSVSVDTACSSSLVAVQLAVQALRTGECTMAVAGGVNLILAPDGSLSFSESGLMAGDGHCKTFDADANGIVRSDGCGVVLLKPLSQAIADGDEIHAVIKGAAVNQDGRSNGLTAPNGLAQEACLSKALDNAGLEANDVAFVETHGTGTILGDPIEVNALNAVYGQNRNAPLVVGSVKANIGHTEGAAGIAGLIKVVLALKHRHVPKQINFSSPNPQIKWAAVNVAVAKDGHSFNATGAPLKAGVSSFGFGGTNAHIILEEAPKTVSKNAGLPSRALHVLPLSAKDPKALRNKLSQLEKAFAQNAVPDLSDLAYTLSTARDHFRQRAVVFGPDMAALRKGIADILEGEESLYGFSDIKREGKEKIAFLFTGAGPQYPGMGRQLYDTEPVFRTAFDACVAYAKPFLQRSLKDIIFCTPGSEEHKLLDRIDYMQPAVFAYEYSMYKLWESLGVQADVVIGHSLGELAAACVAGVFDLESAMKLTSMRGELIYKMPVPGTMASLQASEAEVIEAIGSRSKVSVAVLNGPTQTTVSGEVDEVEIIVAHFDKMGRKTKVLNIARAGHSPLMDPISDAFRAVAAGIAMQQPHTSLISNVSGKVAGPDITTPQYWVDHLRQPVRFHDGLRTLASLSANVLIEAGPNPVLLGISKQAALPAGAIHISSANVEDEKHQQFYIGLAKFYASGGTLDWKAFFAERPGKHCETPLYPFSGSRHWIEQSQKKSALGVSTGQPLLSNAINVAGVEGVYELDVSWKLIPYLRHHQIIDVLIAPGSFHIELILEYLAHTNKDLVLRELSIQRPLFVDEQISRKVQLVVEKQELSDAFSAKIYSSDAAGGDWTMHVAGTLQKPKETAANAGINLEESKKGLDQKLDVKKFYSDLAAIGFHYGESFQGVEELYASHGHALGKLTLHLPAEEAADAARNQLHPTLLDAAFQLLMAAQSDGNSDETYLPFAIENLQLTKPGLSTYWADLKAINAEAGADILSCEISLYDESGAFAGRLDFSCKKASPNQIVAGGNRLRTDWLYDLEWRDYKPGAAEDRPKNLLIVCNDDAAEQYDNFLVEIKSMGIPHTVVSDWNQGKAMLFTAEFDALAAIWDTGLEEGDTVPDKTRETALTALSMLQDITEIAAGKGSNFVKRIFWITSGFASGTVDVCAAPVWGIGRTFVKESNTDLKLVDVDLKTYDTEGLPALMFTAGSENQLRLTDGKAQALRMVKHKSSGAPARKATAKSTYLITGGTGDLGMQAAAWLSQNTDIAHLLLWARRAPSAEVKSAIAAIEKAGTKVTVQSIDVKDATAVKAAIEAVPAAYPLKGILHIAGVAEDALITAQSEEKFDKVLNPKVYGAWNLHEATKDMDLEVFSLYSSLSAIAGVPGVSNYAAGNTFLDALAAHRQRAGKAAHSINWGAWATSTGLLDASRVDDFRKYMRARGVDLIEGEAGLGIMGYTLQQKLSPQTLVAPLILGNQAPFEMASGELQPIYKELFAKAKADAQEDAGHAKSNLRNTLFNLPEGERHEVLAAAIKRQVALVIRHEDPDAIDPDVDLFSLGVDSLMAAEMVSRLSRMIKEPVAPTIIFDQRTVNDLTGFLLEVTIDFSAEEAGNVNVEPDEESTPEESVSERSPVEQSNANGSTQDPDWEEALKKILSDELKRRGKDVAALEESRSLRRQLSRLASVLKKRT